MRPRYGMIHGRFQPFHDGHLEYLRAALGRSEALLVGITNPDPGQVGQEDTSEHRHLPDANPFTFFQRLLMIREVLRDERVSLDSAIIIPFPVNFPDTWRSYLPSDVVHYVRVFSAWEQTKVDRLREYGYRVEVLHPGATKHVEATEVRRRMAAGEDWRALVPPGVARVIESIAEGA
ncbi:MAG: adenylyltransferase/cytidyltransferase family protein [Dehalococcoidia bacterium]|nr:adenylyltransferase/cytidyltransferase family protein [Dehalococcoidia bacterium]